MLCPKVKSLSICLGHQKHIIGLLVQIFWKKVIDHFTLRTKAVGVMRKLISAMIRGVQLLNTVEDIPEA